MKTIEKTKVAVLYGGKSVEHEISLQSAKNIIEHLDRNRYTAIPIGISKEGHWLLGNEIFKKSLELNAVPSAKHYPLWFNPAALKNADFATKEQMSAPVAKENAGETFSPAAALPAFDVIFPAVHGSACEDGVLQGLLELANIPYVGCGVLASAIGMDKDVAKRLVMQAGLSVSPFVALTKAQWLTKKQQYREIIMQKIALPLFVKPANTGSSIGITKVKCIEDLDHAIDSAFCFDQKIVIEKALRVLELEIAVLESLNPGDEPIISVVGEVKPSHEFYSYEAKYLDEEGAQLLVPTTLSTDIQKQAQLMAKIIFTVLECEGMARVDLFYDIDSNTVVFNEINTIPGFTKISMYPRLLEASGILYADLITHLLQLAFNRHEKKMQLAYSYQSDKIDA